MPETYLIDTWVCTNCNYHQDFDSKELEKMQFIFKNYTGGYCPACGNLSDLILEIDEKFIGRSILITENEVNISSDLNDEQKKSLLEKVGIERTRLQRIGKLKS